MLFVDSDTPDTTVASQIPYTFRSFVKAYEASGGYIRGDVKILSDSTEALTIWRNEDPVSLTNPHNLVFTVNTEANEIAATDSYTEKHNPVRNGGTINVPANNVAWTGGWRPSPSRIQR